jgi:phosphatidate cytidylyltransferase
MLPRDERGFAVDGLAFVAVAVHYGALLWSGIPFAAPTAAWTFVVLPLAWLALRGFHGTLTGLPRVQGGVVLTVVCLSHVARLFLLDDAVGPAGGAGWAALLLVLVMSNDAAQFVFGKLFGRHPLAARLSPKKTWEGFAGGLVFTTALGAGVAPSITGLSAVEGAIAGAVLGTAGLLGDLLVSGIKRDAGVKDTGAVLPAHGGILDRCDSLLVAAPLAYYGVLAWLP